MIDLTIPRHEQLRLQNFTAFSDATFEFVPGINVLIGENGSGKTHVMKALYAWQMAMHLADSAVNIQDKALFTETYGAKFTAELQRSKSKDVVISGEFGDGDWLIRFEGSLSSGNMIDVKPSRPIFIPAIEMMAHAKNMNGIMRDYADFDRTCFDFLAMVTAVTSQDLSPSPNNLAYAIDGLREIVPGKAVWNYEEQRFYLTEQTSRQPFQLVAEGIRKVASLSLLIEKKWIQPGTILFWDEPEVNLNPKWMDDIVSTLVALARENVQIFIATHSYVILKALDLVLRAQKLENLENVPTRYFSLRRENEESKVSWADDFASVEPNAILDQYDKMLAEDWRLQDLENRAARNGVAG